MKSSAKHVGNSPKRVLWAVDALQKDGIPSLRSLQAVRAFFGEHEATVEPVYVVSAGQFDFTAPELESTGSYCPKAERKLKDLVSALKGQRLLSPTLLAQSGISHRTAAREMLDYAEGTNASLIAVSTHGRKTVRRLFLGSFTEALILQAKLPVLVTNPRSHGLSHPRQFVFPTDFSDESAAIFDRVVTVAKDFGMEIVLFHKLRLIRPELGYPFLTPPVSKQSVQDLVGKIEERARQWVSRAKSRGVRVSFHLYKGREPVVRAVQDFADRLEGSWLAVGAHSGAVASAILGSVARQIVRAATSPVLVLRSEGEWPARKRKARGREKKRSIPLLT